MNAPHKPFNLWETNGVFRLSSLNSLWLAFSALALITLLHSIVFAHPQKASSSLSSHGHSAPYLVAQNRRSRPRTESKPLNTNQGVASESPAVTVVQDDPYKISYYKRHLPATAALFEPLFYVTLALCGLLILLSLLLPVVRAWFLVSRLFGAGGALHVICAILLTLYLLFFARVHPAELTKIGLRARQEISFAEAGPYDLLKGAIDLPPDFRYTVRSKAGEVIVPVKGAEKFDSSFLHPSRHEKIGHLRLEHAGSHEITTTTERMMAAAPLFIARDYAEEFAAGRWLALFTFIIGIGLWYSGRAVAGITAKRLHRKRLTEGYQFFHLQKGRTPGRISAAHIKVYDRALVLKRKFREREIPRERITSIEKAGKKSRSSLPPFGYTYFEGVRINYQGNGSGRSTIFWSDSYLTREGKTDRTLRQKLKEAGYPVGW